MATSKTIRTPELHPHNEKGIIMDSSLQFQGPGPFDLPVAQGARAEAGTDAVTLSFRVLVEPNRMEVVRISVLNSQALELAAEIATAAVRKDGQKGCS
jgi:hypothetical protein